MKPLSAAMKLKKRERHQRIIDKLRTHITVRISELAQQFGVTTETVRRDLKELSQKGLVNRTYGGAAGLLAKEPAIRLRETVKIAERTRIAREAWKLIKAGDVLMIDPGATTIHFARHLSIQAVEISVLTNCVGVAGILGENPKIRVILCPGEFGNRENSVFGLETNNFLKRFHANKAIIGASGLTTEGLEEVHSDVSWVKRTMIERSDQTILLVDSSKFNIKRMELVCPLADISDIVVDEEPDAALRDALNAASVNIHLAG